MKEPTVESHHTSLISPTTLEDSHAPTLVSPPGTKTPPSGVDKRTHIASKIMNGSKRAGSEPVDPSALSKALRDFERAGSREPTPGASPSRKRQRVYGDRSVVETCLCKGSKRLTRVSISLDLSQTEKAKISRQASVSYTMMHRRLRPQKQRGGRPMVSYTSSEVSPS